ncbi:regulatory YrvL family protein [Bacillus cytotoxicus]|uniref:Regulatory YrvL family protein n=1 Tax=Bacillus cytotoxicus TaxID=580165 RepID=A0ACC6A577_9BACI|nr:regulatory YrvL family protein [Bacillus cytotoxicus]
MEKLKTIFICTLLLLPILLVLLFFDFILLNLFGLKYDSKGSLLIFFSIYLILEVPTSLVIGSSVKAFKTVGILRSSKGLLPFILNTAMTFFLISIIDYFMTSIIIPLKGIIIFSIISGLIGVLLRDNEPEPPDIDSEEFKKINNRFS